MTDSNNRYEESRRAATELLEAQAGSSNFLNAQADQQSDRFMAAFRKIQQLIRPVIDFRDPSTFAFFGSAEQYYKDSFNRISNTYPYDGSNAERLEWTLSASALDISILRHVYPKSTGHMVFCSDGTSGTNIDVQNDYTLTNAPEYIYFSGEPKPNTRVLPALRMGNNLEIDGNYGNTVEFWLKKESFGSNKNEVIFDICTQNTTINQHNYGRFTIEINGSTSSPFILTYMSGTTGFQSEQLNTSLDASKIADNKWHHYAIAVNLTGSDSSTLKARLYIDGMLDVDSNNQPLETIKQSSKIGIVSGHMSGTIGALAAKIRQQAHHSPGGLGYGRLSGSLDDVRFWKISRNAKQIGTYYDKPVYGATLDDVTRDPHISLYYKMNEGILENASIDNNVLDYSGRINNGIFKNYKSSTRQTESAITLSTSPNYEAGDPIIYDFHSEVNRLRAEYIEKGLAYDKTNNSSLAKSVPQWAYDAEGFGSSNIESDMGILIQAIASEFDTAKNYIDNILRIKSTEVLDFSNISNSEYAQNSDYYLFGCANEFGVNFSGMEDNSKLAELQLKARGWNLTEDVSERSYETSEEFYQAIGQPQSTPLSFEQNTYEIRNKILKNVYRNLTQLYKVKGTEKSFRNLIRCFGVGEELIKLNVYAQNEEREIKNEPVFISTKKKSISFQNDNKNVTLFQTATTSEESRFISGSDKITPWSAEACFIFPKYVNKTAEVINSSLYGAGQAIDDSVKTTTSEGSPTPAQGTVTVTGNPSHESVITLDDGQGESLSQIKVQYRKDFTGHFGGVGEDQYIDFTAVPVYTEISNGANAFALSTSTGGFAQFYLTPKRLKVFNEDNTATFGDTYNGMWRTHWSKGKSEALQIEILDAAGQILYIKFEDVASFDSPLTTTTSNKVAYGDRVKRNGVRDYSIGTQFSTPNSSAPPITEWMYNVSLAITDAVERNEIKLQIPEVAVAGTGNLTSDNPSESSGSRDGFTYFFVGNGGGSAISIRVAADSRTLGNGTGSPLAVRIAPQTGASWTTLANGALFIGTAGNSDKLNGATPPNTPEHFWNGDGPRFDNDNTGAFNDYKKDPGVNKFMSENLNNTTWLFAPGGMPGGFEDLELSPSTSGRDVTAANMLTNAEIAAQKAQVLNNLPIGFNATADGNVINIVNQTPGAAGNTTTQTRDGSTNVNATDIAGGADATPETTSYDHSSQLVFNVSAIKGSGTTKNAYFKLASSEGHLPELTSNYYASVYDDSKWNFAVTVSKDSLIPLGSIDNSGYQINFIGKQYDLDVLRNSFHLSASITQTQYEYWSKYNKHFYMGAERQFLTGTLSTLADTRGVFLNIWSDKLTHNEIKEHALNTVNKGRENPQFINTHDVGKNVLNANNLALSWHFDNLTSPDSDSKISITDYSSGSSENISKYGKPIGYKHPGTSTVFADPKSAIEQEYLAGIEYVGVDNAYTSDRVKVLEDEADIFTADSRPVTYLFSFEKSMYQVISKEMLNFVAGLVSYNNLLGEPVNKYRQEYKLLQKIKERFFQDKQNVLDLEKFVNYYKWIDSSLGNMLRELQPASSEMNSDFRNVVESHALERSKYEHKFPTPEYKDPAKITPIFGINELIYDWEHGHAPLGFPEKEEENCLWHSERSERSNEKGRSTLRDIITRNVEGSTYALRSLTKPYVFSTERQNFLLPGSNRKANKIKGLYKIVNSGKEITIGSEDIYDFKRCDDIINPQEEKIYTAKTNTEGTNGYLDADADLLLPFTLYSSSVGVDFSNFKSNLSITNNHDDNGNLSLQSPFTRAHAGGPNHRRVPFGTADSERTEAYDITSTNTKLTIKASSRGPKSLVNRSVGAPAYNIKNIKYNTDSLLAGNYSKDYEIVMTNGRSINNNYFVDQEGAFLEDSSFVTSEFISGAVDFIVPDRGRTEHVVVNRFSSPGGPETAGAYGRDRPAGEYSVYNTINYRNFNVRSVLNDLHAEYSGLHGYRTSSTSQASVHMTNRNPTRFVARNHLLKEIKNIESVTLKTAKGMISTTGNPSNNETFQLTNTSGDSVAFIFKTGLTTVDGTKDAGKVIIGLQGASGHAPSCGDRIRDAINNSGLGIVAAGAGGGNVSLTQNLPGADGNTAIDMSGVATTTATDFSGGQDPDGADNNNFFVQRPIPQNDFGYAWIRISADNRLGQDVYTFLDRNGNYGYQHDFNNLHSSSVGGLLYSKETILFQSASQYGSYSTNTFGPIWGLEREGSSIGGSRTQFIPQDFVGLNTHTYEPLDATTNTLGHGLDKNIGRGKVGGSRYVPLENVDYYFNHFFLGRINANDPNLSPPLRQGDITGLNALIHHRQGPYGWPSWKQIRGGKHPVVRQHRKDNTFSIVVRANNYNASALSSYEFNWTNSEEDIPGSVTKTNSRSVKNYKDMFITSRYKPVSMIKHKLGDGTGDTELRGLTTSWPQIYQHKFWNQDEYEYNLYATASHQNVAGFVTEVLGGTPRMQKYDGLMSLKMTYGNDLSLYANPEIVKDLRIDDNTVHKINTIMPVWFPPTSTAEQDRRSTKELREVSYIESIFPREENTYAKIVRARENFVFHGWNSSRLLRENILTGSAAYEDMGSYGGASFIYRNLKAFPDISKIKEGDFTNSSLGIERVNTSKYETELSLSPAITASSWVLDSRRDFAATPLNINSSFFNNGLTFLQNNTQGTRGEGLFQNDYGTYAMGYNGLYGTPPISIIYNRRTPQKYGKNTYLAGEAKFQSADNKRGPFYNSYEDYNDKIRRIGQSYSIVPEFRISEFVEKYYDNDTFGDVSVMRNEFLSLTGATYHSPTGDLQIGTQFFKTYATSDFMKYFGVVAEKLAPDLEPEDRRGTREILETRMYPTKFTLRCKAAKKFLPYRGFYPAERVAQLGEIFQRSYLKKGFYESSLKEAVFSYTADQRETLLEKRINASKQQSMKLFFGPGILNNSIKSGLAVDYPIFTYSAELNHITGAIDSVDQNLQKGTTFIGGTSLLEPNSLGLSPLGIVTGSYINKTQDGGIPRLSGSVLSNTVVNRISFEDMLNVENIYETLVYDNEPHPSASLYYGNKMWNNIIERPFRFGNLNKSDLDTDLQIDFDTSYNSFVNSMRPFKSAMQNFAAETVSFFLDGESLQTISSPPVKAYMSANQVYKMRIYVDNASTVMYDRHSAFGPPVDANDCIRLVYKASEPSNAMTDIVLKNSYTQPTAQLNTSIGQAEQLPDATEMKKNPYIKLTEFDTNTSANHAPQTLETYLYKPENYFSTFYNDVTVHILNIQVGDQIKILEAPAGTEKTFVATGNTSHVNGNGAPNFYVGGTLNDRLTNLAAAINATAGGHGNLIRATVHASTYANREAITLAPTSHTINPDGVVVKLEGTVGSSANYIIVQNGLRGKAAFSTNTHTRRAFDYTPAENVSPPNSAAPAIGTPVQEPIWPFNNLLPLMRRNHTIAANIDLFQSASQASALNDAALQQAATGSTYDYSKISAPYPFLGGSIPQTSSYNSQPIYNPLGPGWIPDPTLKVTDSDSTEVTIQEVAYERYMRHSKFSDPRGVHAHHKIFVPRSARGKINVNGIPQDDETFQLKSTAGGLFTFVFKDDQTTVDGSTDAGRIIIGISLDASQTTPFYVSDRIARAINNSAAPITATVSGGDGGGVGVSLIQDDTGYGGNTVIDVSGVSNATATDFSGGVSSGGAPITTINQNAVAFLNITKVDTGLANRTLRIYMPKYNDQAEGDIERKSGEPAGSWESIKYTSHLIKFINTGDNSTGTRSATETEVNIWPALQELSKDDERQKLAQDLAGRIQGSILAVGNTLKGLGSVERMASVATGGGPRPECIIKLTMRQPGRHGNTAFTPANTDGTPATDSAPGLDDGSPNYTGPYILIWNMFRDALVPSLPQLHGHGTSLYQGFNTAGQVNGGTAPSGYVPRFRYGDTPKSLMSQWTGTGGTNRIWNYGLAPRDSNATPWSPTYTSSSIPGAYPTFAPSGSWIDHLGSDRNMYPFLKAAGHEESGKKDLVATDFQHHRVNFADSSTIFNNNELLQHSMSLRAGVDMTGRSTPIENDNAVSLSPFSSIMAITATGYQTVDINNDQLYPGTALGKVVLRKNGLASSGAPSHDPTRGNESISILESSTGPRAIAFTGVRFPSSSTLSPPEWSYMSRRGGSAASGYQGFYDNTTYWSEFSPTLTCSAPFIVKFEFAHAGGSAFTNYSSSWASIANVGTSWAPHTSFNYGLEDSGPGDDKKYYKVDTSTSRNDHMIGQWRFMPQADQGLSTDVAPFVYIDCERTNFGDVNVHPKLEFENWDGTTHNIFFSDIGAGGATNSSVVNINTAIIPNNDTGDAAEAFAAQLHTSISLAIDEGLLLMTIGAIENGVGKRSDNTTDLVNNRFKLTSTLKGTQGNGITVGGSATQGGLISTNHALIRIAATNASNPNPTGDCKGTFQGGVGVSKPVPYDFSRWRTVMEMAPSNRYRGSWNTGGFLVGNYLDTDTDISQPIASIGFFSQPGRPYNTIANNHSLTHYTLPNGYNCEFRIMTSGPNVPGTSVWALRSLEVRSANTLSGSYLSAQQVENPHVNVAFYNALVDMTAAAGGTPPDATTAEGLSSVLFGAYSWLAGERMKFLKEKVNSSNVGIDLIYPHPDVEELYDARATANTANAKHELWRTFKETGLFQHANRGPAGSANLLITEDRIYSYYNFNPNHANRPGYQLPQNQPLGIVARPVTVSQNINSPSNTLVSLDAGSSTLTITLPGGTEVTTWKDYHDAEIAALETSLMKFIPTQTKVASSLEGNPTNRTSTQLRDDILEKLQDADGGLLQLSAPKWNQITATSEGSLTIHLVQDITGPEGNNDVGPGHASVNDGTTPVFAANQIFNDTYNVHFSGGAQAGASTTVTKQIVSGTHGFMPYVPPYLDPGASPYVEINFTASAGSKFYSAREIVENLTASYYNFSTEIEPPGGLDKNRSNYKHAMSLSASINFSKLVELGRDKYITTYPFRDVDNDQVVQQNPDFSEFGTRWVIQPRWETPIHNFSNVSASVLDLSDNTEKSVANSPWKTRYWDDYFTLTGSMKSYLTASIGMWHQHGSSSRNSTEGYYLRIEDVGPNGLASKVGFLRNIDNYFPTAPGTVYTMSMFNSMTANNYSVKLGNLAPKKTIKEAVVAIPYYTTDNTKISFFELNSHKYQKAQEMNDQIIDSFLEKASRLNIDDKAGLQALIEDYNIRASVNGGLPEECIAYQLRMMRRYILPPFFDFLKVNTIDPLVMYFFEFNAVLNDKDLSNIWQNLYPESTGSTAHSSHTRPYKQVEPSREFDTSYCSHILDTKVVSDLAVQYNSDGTQTRIEGRPFGRLSPYAEPGKFIEEKVRWLVFKVKYRGERDYKSLVKKSIDPIHYFERMKTRDESLVNIVEDEGKQITEEFSYNWPYDYFSFVELIKLDSKVDFYGYGYRKE